MENKYLKKRKWIVIGAILLVLTLTISGTYALWNYFKVGPNQQLVAGDIYMKYTETNNTINIQDAMPTSTYGEDYFEFTIEGKNTYTKPIWYEIVINYGAEPTDRHTRIPDKFLRFRLTEELPGEEEQEVIAEGKYEDFSKGTKIWVNTIGANQTDEIKITYKLYMWVSDEMHLGAGDDADSSDMSMDTWNKDAFASVKVTVNGDFEEKSEVSEVKLSSKTENIALNAKSKIKITAPTNGTFMVTAEQPEIATPTLSTEKGSETVLTVEGKQEGTTNININFKPDGKLYKETTVTYNISVDKKATSVVKATIGETGGIIGVSNSNLKLEEENEDIREYRYSGLGVNNYVTFNEELWRIIGVFKDESGEEHLKIVRNKLIEQEDFPETYTVNGTSFNIRFTDVSGNYAYWNSKLTKTNYNDWTTAGLMYWLNPEETDSIDTGYLNKMSDSYKNMIYGAKWNLGNIEYKTDTPITAYEHERGSTPCSSCSGGDVLNGNSAIWEGKIALMYPSDYGFSTDSSNWTSNMNEWRSSQLNSTWLKEGHTDSEWFLSPSSAGSYYVAGWHIAGLVNVGSAYNNMGAVRPSLYLKSDVEIISGAGTGTSDSPYELSCSSCNASLPSNQEG